MPRRRMASRPAPARRPAPPPPSRPAPPPAQTAPPPAAAAPAAAPAASQGPGIMGQMAATAGLHKIFLLNLHNDIGKHQYCKYKNILISNRLCLSEIFKI